MLLNVIVVNSTHCKGKLLVNFHYDNNGPNTDIFYSFKLMFFLTINQRIFNLPQKSKKKKEFIFQDLISIYIVLQARQQNIKLFYYHPNKIRFSIQRESLYIDIHEGYSHKYPVLNARPQKLYFVS